MPDWPRSGRCGACGRAALDFPSGRWEHVGRPCRARSQTLWGIDSVNILRACVFVADGEQLPAEPDRAHWHTTRRDETGFPVELGWCTADHMPSVREVLAREAEMAPSSVVYPLAVE